MLFLMHLSAAWTPVVLVDFRHAAFAGIIFVVVHLVARTALPEQLGFRLVHGFLQAERRRAACWCCGGWAVGLFGFGRRVVVGYLSQHLFGWRELVLRHC